MEAKFPQRQIWNTDCLHLSVRVPNTTLKAALSGVVAARSRTCRLQDLSAGLTADGKEAACEAMKVL